MYLYFSYIYMCFRLLLLINCLNWFYLKHDNWGFFSDSTSKPPSTTTSTRAAQSSTVSTDAGTQSTTGTPIMFFFVFCFFFKYQLTVSIHLWWEIVHLLLYRYQTLSCRLLRVLREMQVLSYSFCRIKQNIDESFISKRAWWSGPFFTLYLLPLDKEL